MESRKEMGNLGKIFSVFPSRGVITLPFHQILQTRVKETKVQEFINLSFFITINDYWRSRRGNMIRQRVCSVGFQLRDMEDGMYLHGGRKVEFIGIGANN